MTTKTKALVAVAVLLIGTGVWTLRRQLGRSAPAAAQTLAVIEGPIEEAVEATGAVAAMNRVEIKPPISGRIERLLVDEGGPVKAGQIVAWMSSTDRAAILDAARAKGPEELKKWEDAYKATPIVASLPGMVILRNVVVGQSVDAGTVLFATADTLIVVAQVDESDIGRIKPGMAARITLDSYPDRGVEGKVIDILYEGKNVSNVITYGVKVRPERVPDFFRSQMTANVSFIVSRKENAALLPLTAVRDAGPGVKQVAVPGPDGQALVREIKTGVENGDMVEILSGLKPGDKVLVSQGKYVPQQAPQSSPLTFGGRKRSGESQFGSAPKPKKRT